MKVTVESDDVVCTVEVKNPAEGETMDHLFDLMRQVALGCGYADKLVAEYFDATD